MSIKKFRIYGHIEDEDTYKMIYSGFYFTHDDVSGLCLPKMNDERHICDADIMQYTELKDKNGKEIYEGDIIPVEFQPYNSNPYSENYQVFFGEYDDWEGYQWDTHIGFHLFKKGDCEENNKTHPLIDEINNGSCVIGNIYENPELLEGE